MMLKQHKHMPVNVEGRDWFVGDLHGHYSLLMKTLEQMGFDFDRDRLFAVGDLIDRGPESPECIRLLLEPWFHSVCGNHECMFINGRLADDHPHIHGMHIKNGGAWAYEISEKEGNELFQIIRSYMPMCLTVDTLRGSVGVVHAQAPRDWKKVLDGFVSENGWKEYLWSVYKYNQALSKRSVRIENVDAVVMGHVGCDYITTGANQVWIDTVMRSGRLTVIDSGRVFEEVEHG